MYGNTKSIWASGLVLKYQLFPTNGTLGFRVFVPTAQAYSLDVSTNLTNWFSIFTNQSGALGNDFIEPSVTNSPHRFFRGKRWP